MVKNSNITKSDKSKCEEDIKYIREKMVSSFTFDFLSSEISSDEQDRYYRQLHLLLYAFILTYKLQELERILFLYVDTVQKPDVSIRCIVKNCELKTLGFEEQFAVFCLLSKIDKDNIRTLLELSMDDCDTHTYQTLLDVFCSENYEYFKAQAITIKYSASKVSRVAQAICIHSKAITDFFYDHMERSILLRIENYNKDFLSYQSLTIPDYYYVYSHTLAMLPLLRGLDNGRLISSIDGFLLDYGDICAAKNSERTIPSTIEYVLPRMVLFRKMMLEQYISDIVDELKGDQQEEQNPLAPPPLYTGESVSLTDKPTNITTTKNRDAYCKAFASLCKPNAPIFIQHFFWNIGGETLSEFPKQIEWISTKKMFAAYLHYAYKDQDLPKHTEELVKRLFIWGKKKEALDIKGYGLKKYEDCFKDVETAIKLNLEGQSE